ncbi:hypothetical protein [uncultured Cardiobacterium sp.]|uniref:hypothetical protein n=1 Tax=uncultured Cardiobacterium sp. TaxID=417619 RepID=UPI002629C033|nr:hypothetical protein [uncultured Cardiobacterium sp.]
MRATYKDNAGHDESPLSEATVEIRADQPPANDVPTLNLQGVSSVQEGETAQYTLSLSKAAAQDVRVEVEIQPLDASNSNIQPETRTLTIAKGETKLTFDVETAHNGVADGNKAYSVTLKNAEGATLASATSPDLSHGSGGSSNSHEHHFSAAGLEGNYRLVSPEDSDRGLVMYLHGDGVKGYPSSMSDYLEQMADKGFALLVPQTPDTATGTWWKNGEQNAAYLRAMIEDVCNRYNVDKGNIWLVGYSGGAELISYYLLPQHNDLFSGGGALMIGGGGMERPLQFGKTPTDELKQRFQLKWLVGSEDNGAEFDALAASQQGQERYAQAGFHTQREIIPGVDHVASADYGANVLGELFQGKTRNGMTTTVMDIDGDRNHAPTDIQLSASEIREGIDGVIVGKLTTIDPDAGDTHSYLLSDSRFEVTADGTLKLRAGQHLDFATEQTVTLLVETTDSGGRDFSKTFTLTVQDDPNYPGNNQRGSIAITGGSTAGQTLTAHISDGDGFDADKVQYQWMRDGVAIDKANGKTYTLTPDDAGHKITVQAVYKDHAQHDENPISSPLDIANTSGNHEGMIDLGGTGIAGSPLTATIQDSDGVPTSGVKYQWFLDGEPIAGVTGNTYTPRFVDIGSHLTASAEYTDNAGNHETVERSTTIKMPNGNDWLARVQQAEKQARDSLLDTPADATTTADLSDAKWGADMTARLQNAINDPNIRHINIPAGHYSIGQINLAGAENKIISGQGSATVLTYNKDHDNAAILIPSGSNTHHIHLRNFVLDMQWKNGDAAANAIQITDGEHIQISKLAIKNSGGSAILAQGYQKAGSGSSHLRVIDNDIDGAGLADRTDGFGVMIKDASPDAAIIGNRIHNIKGGMGIGGHATEFGAPTGIAAIDNHIEMTRSTTAFEGIGLTKGADNAIIAKNTTVPSYDNGLSISSDNNLVIQNHTDGAWNHGIAIGGSGNIIVANDIRNIGKQNAALNEKEEYAGIALENAGENLIAGNHIEGGDMTYAVKYNAPQQGGNYLSYNDISGWSKREHSISPAADDRSDSYDPRVPLLTAAERDAIADNAGPDATNTANHTGNISITGEAKLGSELTAVIEDSDGVAADKVQYQWLRDGQPIDKANGSTYTLSKDDAGHKISVRAVYKDNAGHDENPTSEVTDIPAPPPNQPGSIAISGEAKMGSTLTATITDSDGVAADKVQYQWLRDGQPIDKANGSTYTLGKDDAGHKITVQATYKDNAGHDENPQDSITTEAAATNKIQVSDAAAVTEGKSLHYTIKLDAPAQAGQTLKISASHHNSAVEADKLAQTADPFQPGEYLGNGTVFTRSVANMPLADNSAAITQYAPSMAKNNYGVVTGLNHKSYNIPIYIVDSSDPKQHYATITSDDARVNASADIKAHTTGKIPLPEYATPAGGGDKSFAVYDKATGLMREYFYAVKQPDGSWKVSAAGYFQGQAGLDDLGVKNYWMQHEHGGSAVVRMLNPLSQIGISEILAGRINHAVSVTLPNARKGVTSFPAQDSDGTDENPNAPAEGQWFRIKPGVDLDTYTRGGQPLGELTKMIAKAVQTYGGYGADKNLNNFAFNAESAHNYLARGKEDPWREGGEIAQKVGNMNINDFPWELVEWAPVGWNDKGQDAGVYSNTQPTASINGQEVPITGGEITLPAGATEVHINVPTLTHNNFEQTDSVTLNAELHDTNGNLLDSGTGTGQVNDAPNPIADSTHGNGVLISPNVNPDELAKLVSLDGQELIDYIDQHGHNILQNVQNPTASPVLRGGDGDDILVSGYGVDHLAGGKGADTFVYIMDGKNSFPYQNNDQILDFNPAEGDRIVLTRGDGWTLQFDKVEFVADAHVQRLQYKVYKGTEAYINAIHIQSHDGHLFGVEEIMKAVTIM